MSYHVFDNSPKTQGKPQENKKIKNIYRGATRNSSTFTLSNSVSAGGRLYLIHGVSISKS